MNAPVVGDTRPDQLPAIAAIYAAAVADGPATFDLDPPPLAWWSSVLEAVDPSAGHLMLSALDADGSVLGYAKSGTFRPKAAYDSTCETSIYVGAYSRGRGVGDALYRELLGPTRPQRPAARGRRHDGPQPGQRAAARAPWLQRGRAPSPAWA